MLFSDAELFQAWRRERDAEAFKALTQRYGGLVYAAALRILGNVHEAEEVAQESFVSLAMTSTPPKGAVAPWLHRVATNRALDRVRTDRNRQRREQAYADAQGAESPATAWADIFAYVDEAIDALPDKYRVPMVRHFYENCSGAAIAAELGITRQAANYRIRNGVDLVRRTLRKRGVSVASATLATLLGTHLAEAAPLPASLSLTFGKLAIAGVLNPSTGITTSMAATLGGLFIMKKVLVGGAIILVALAGTWMALHRPLPEAAPAPSSYVSRAEAAPPAEDAGPVSKEAAQAEPAAPEPDVATGDITGRIYDVVTGKGIAGAFPSLGSIKSEKASPWQTAGTCSDANGVYYLRGFKPGRYTLFSPKELRDYPETVAIARTITVVANTVVRNVDFALEPGVAVDGVVLSREGKPVEGATVYAHVYVYVPTCKETKSGQDGQFSFCLPTGQGFMDLQAGKERAFSPKMRHVALRPEGVKGMVLTLSESATASISGLVVGARNQPVPGATVELRDEFVPLGQNGLASATTDANGFFQIRALLAGDYEIYLAGPEAGMPRERNTLISLREGEARDDLRLSLGENLFISGHVVDPQGNGIAQAQIQAQLKKDIGVLYEFANSQADGRFTLSLVEKGEYTLSANHGAYQLLFFDEGPVVAAGTSDIKIVLEPAGQIEGRVCDTMGKPITQFSLFMVYDWGSSGSLEVLLKYSCLVSRTYDPEGRFEVATTARKTKLFAMAPGFAPTLKEVEVPAGKTVTGVELRLTPSGRVEGWVVDGAGAAVPGARIFFGAVENRLDLTKTVAWTDSTGYFALDTLPAEVSTLCAVHPSYAPGVVRIEAKMKIVLRSGGSVKGRIMIKGQPSPDASLSIQYPEQAGATRFWERTTADGNYQFSNLPEGPCQLHAYHSGGNGLQRNIRIVSGETRTEDFSFDSGGSMIHGRIIAPGIDPESIGLVLVLTRDQGEQVYRSHGNADGTYQIEGVEAGTGQLIAFVGEEKRCIINVEIPEDGTVEQDLELEAVGAVSGMLLGITPEQIGVVTLLKGAVDLSGLATVEDIQAFIPEATRIAVFQVKCDDAGYYEIRGLPYNTYTLIAQTVSRADENDISQWRWTAMQVVLEEDNKEMNLDFDLRP